MRRRRRKKTLPPSVVQALIWGGAIAACLVFATVVFIVSGRGRPMLPEPQAIPVGTEALPGGPAVPASSGKPSAEPALPAEGPSIAGPGSSPSPTGPQPAPPGRPRKLTEDLFVEVSALMLVAADSFTDSEVGQRSFERACEGILEQQGISRADFEGMEEEIAQDPQRQARVVDRVLERADQLRHPKNIRSGTSPGGVVDPRREPPPPPTPPR